MAPEPVRDQQLQLAALDAAPDGRLLLWCEQRQVLVVFRVSQQVLGDRRRQVARRHEHHDLLALLDDRYELVVADEVHRVLVVLVLDADEGLRERDRAEAVVEEEQPGVGADLEEVGHVEVAGQCGREGHYADDALAAEDLAQGARDEGFDHGAAVGVEEVDLVEDEEFDETSDLGVH